MELSLFLAKLIGLYFLIFAALWIVRRQVISGVVEELLASRPMVFLNGIIALVIGIAMTIGHSIWEPNWRGLITLIGYLAIVQGVVRSGFPDLPGKMAGRILKGSGQWVWLSVIVILGAYLTWAGFTKS